MIWLARLRDELLDRLASEVRSWSAPPVLGALFGSGARRDHSAQSDIDLLLVRPIDVIDDAWDDQTESLSIQVTAWTGNDCRILTLTLTQTKKAGRAMTALVDAARRTQ